MIIKIAVPLNCISNFWITLEMSLINCEIKLTLILSVECVISAATGITKFAMTDTKIYVSVVKRMQNW